MFEISHFNLYILEILMQEFAELTDRARSSLALSEYEESIHCYEKALENSASLLTSITNAVEKEKWEEVFISVL